MFLEFDVFLFLYVSYAVFFFVHGLVWVSWQSQDIHTLVMIDFSKCPTVEGSLSYMRNAMATIRDTIIGM